MATHVTIDDIARLAGVSKATVSRVLNQKPDVDTETRERIMRIMREQGFVRNPTADGLARGKNRLIGMLVPSLTWPLMTEVMRGVGAALEQSQYELILYSISHEEDRATSPGHTNAVLDRILATKLTAGLVAMFPGAATQHVSALHTANYPVIIVDDQGLPTNTPWIGVDNRGGGYQATRRLLELGHRRIAFIAGPSTYQCSHERYDGYAQALAEAGLQVDPALLLRGDYELPSGREAARALLSLEDRPTAVFASNDLMAYGILEVAAERGVRIPDEIALVGFDDIMPSAHTMPALTTIRQPFFEMGKEAITRLLALVERAPVGSGRAAPQSTEALADLTLFFPTQLIVRASCGATRSASRL